MGQVLPRGAQKLATLLTPESWAPSIENHETFVVVCCGSPKKGYKHHAPCHLP